MSLHVFRIVNQALPPRYTRREGGKRLRGGQKRLTRGGQTFLNRFWVRSARESKRLCVNKSITKEDRVPLHMQVRTASLTLVIWIDGSFTLLGRVFVWPGRLIHVPVTTHACLYLVILLPLHQSPLPPSHLPPWVAIWSYSTYSPTRIKSKK